VEQLNKKRKHRRYTVTGSADLKYERQGQNQLIHALITDVSLSGIGLYLDGPLEDTIDVSLNITFISSDGSIKTDAINGRIVYSRKFKDVYFTGIQFHKEINIINQPSLYEHLDAISLLDK
jgi:hypothetical protein